ncbi:hypothetical protein D3C78_1794970 [compost metagenome]
MAAGAGGTAAVVVAARFISLITAQQPAGIDAATIVEDSNELAAWVRQIESADTVAGAVCGADLGEQGGIDTARHGGAVGPKPTRWRRGHGKRADTPDL